MQDLIHSIILYSSHTFIGCILVGNNSFSVVTHFTGLYGYADKSMAELLRRTNEHGGVFTMFALKGRGGGSGYRLLQY